MTGTTSSPLRNFSITTTLYTAKNNGGNDNGDSTTVVITTTMANNGIGFRDIQSLFLCFHVEILGPYKFTNDVAGCTGIAWTERVQSRGVEIFHL